MRIQFTKKDPRAGMIAEVQGITAKRLIESGSAVEVPNTTSGKPATPSEEQKAVTSAAIAAKSPAKKASKK
jgi:hypothetical protein